MNNKPYKFLFLFLLLITFSVQGKGAADLHKKILIIDSYSPIKEIGGQVITSFSRTIQEKENIHISVEYMDCESTPYYPAWIHWMQLLFHAYKEQPDLVVILGQEAWCAYKNTCPESWSHIPITLGCVKKGFVDFSKLDDTDYSSIHEIGDIPSTISSFGHFRVTGYYTTDYIEENIRFIKQLQPEIRDIIFYYDDRYNFTFFQKYLASIVENIDSLKLHYISGNKYSTAQLLDSITQMNDSSYALLTAGWYTDANHYPHAYSMLYNELSRQEGQYIYQLTDLGLKNKNYIGGYFVSGEEQGRDIAELAYCILQHGIENSPSFGITPSRPQYHINYMALKALKIDKSRLPAHAIIHQAPLSIVEAHPVEMVIVGVFFLFLILFFCLLLLYRKRKDEAIRIYNRKMQQFLSKMPNTAFIYNTNLQLTDIINPMKSTLHFIDPDKLIGLKIKDIGKTYPELGKAVVLIEENLRKTIQTRQDFSFIYEIEWMDTIFYAEARTAPFEKDKVICFVHDTTARVKAENEVLKLQTFLQSVISSLPLGVFVKNASDNFRYFFYNEKCVDFYGKKASYFLNKNDHEVMDPEADRYRQEDEMVLKSNTPLTFERVLYNKDGQPYRWGITTKMKLDNNDGSTYIIAVLVETTETRKREIELSNARNELAIALDAGCLSAWLYDVKKQQFSSLYGNTVSDNGLDFEAAYSILHPEDKKRYVHLMESLIAGSVSKSSEILRFFQNGKYNWFETHAIALCSVETGEINQIVGTQKEITQDIEKQLELEESKLKLELALDAADMVPWNYNVAENLFYSDNGHSIFYTTKYTREHFLSNIHPNDRDTFSQQLDAVINGTKERLEMRILCLFDNGTQEWAYVSAKAAGRGENGIAKKIIGTRKYVTREVEAEQKLKADKFKSDLAIKSVGIMQWDYDVPSERFSSPNLESFIHEGITRNDYLATFHPDDVHMFVNGLQRLAKGENSVANIQIRQYRPGIGLRWVEIHCVAFEREENGQLKKVTGLLRDITDLKELMNELAEKQKTEEMNRLKSAFLANMSHEIRTPLNAIVGFSNLISQTEDKNEIKEFNTIIETNNELLLQLINDILDLSKIEAGQLDFIFSSIDIRTIFSTLETIYKYKIKDGVELICCLPQQTCVIYSEKNRLTQVLSNFIGNACKFTDKGYIKIGYEPIAEGLRFYVEDTGKGIAKQNLPHVFERFAKFDSFVQGTGLGLSICQTIVHHLGGQIGVESEVGKGCTFWFTIPCKIESGQPAPEPDVPRPPAPSPKPDSKKQLTILVAEDNDSNFLLISKILGQKYNLVRAVDGCQAVKRYHEYRPDLVLMDIKMPQMDGLAATREIRKTGSTTPIIALTAHAFGENREQALEAGCNDFITKPINRSQLEGLLDKYLCHE